MTVRDHAQATVRFLRLAPRCIEGLSNNRQLTVTGAPSSFPPFVVAQYALRTALENDCTRISVRQGPHRRTEFEVLDVIEACRQGSPGGTLATPRMRFVPANFGTMKQLAVGNTLDRDRPLVVVPSGIQSTPVSGPMTGGKGASHV